MEVLPGCERLRAKACRRVIDFDQRQRLRSAVCDRDIDQCGVTASEGEHGCSRDEDLEEAHSGIRVTGGKNLLAALKTCLKVMRRRAILRMASRGSTWRHDSRWDVVGPQEVKKELQKDDMRTRGVLHS